MARSTIITYATPAKFSPVRTEKLNGKEISFGANGEMAINGRVVETVSRRGHKDPLEMRAIALAKGAIDDEMTVTQHVVTGCKSWQNAQVAKFIVDARGPLKVSA